MALKKKLTPDEAMMAIVEIKVYLNNIAMVESMSLSSRKAMKKVLVIIDELADFCYAETNPYS